MREKSNVWEKQATVWERVGSPLRPCPQDQGFMQRVIHEVHSRTGPPRVLVLGVTPEMVRLAWPQQTVLMAVDRSSAMIDRVWPGFPAPREGALCADWLELALAKHSRTLVVGDGPFGVLRYPDEYRRLLGKLRGILHPAGRFAFRVFVRPEADEQAETVYRDAMAGVIANFHAFKLRLLMALQPHTAAGVRTGDVWLSWAADGPGVEALVSRCGWTAEQIRTIDAYRDQDTVYSFPTLAELRDAIAAQGFETTHCWWPSYALGERCPTLVCAPAGDSGQVGTAGHADA